MITIFSRNRFAVVVGAIIAVGVATMMVVRQTKPRPLATGRQVYFYDLDGQTLFAASETKLPPITSPAGARAVQARVFSCGDCAEVSERKVVYLETLTDEAHAQLVSDTNTSRSSRETAALLDAGLRVAPKPPAGEEPRWVTAAGAEGLALQGKAARLCDGNPARTCKP